MIRYQGSFLSRHRARLAAAAGRGTSFRDLRLIAATAKAQPLVCTLGPVGWHLATGSATGGAARALGAVAAILRAFHSYSRSV